VHFDDEKCGWLKRGVGVRLTADLKKLLVEGQTKDARKRG